MARTSAPKTATGNTILSLKVTLQGMKPPVWRRLLVPGTMKLGELHTAVQAVMGWEDDHLHAFDINGKHYGNPQTVDDIADENSRTLNSVKRSGVARFTYIYDFGDKWVHRIAIEKRVPAIEGQACPVCVAGKRNCPPEDSGGVWGFQDMLAVVADPGHPDHAERLEWIGEGFDPDHFDIESTNARLAAWLKSR